MIRTDYLFRLYILLALTSLPLTILSACVQPAQAEQASLKGQKIKETQALSAGSANSAKKIETALPSSGEHVAGMEDFDREFSGFLKHWEIPGASVAIVYKGKLVFARGYGYADNTAKEPVKPDSLFRMCSISKLLTSAAILKLVGDGKLSLDTKAFPLLDLPLEKDPSRRPDPRINTITIRHLLQGAAGWDRKANGDPMFVPIVQETATLYSNTLRPTARSVIRYEYSRNLDFTPGTQFCYSNFEYAVLGEIISKITGQKYEDYVKSKILAPIGITGMRAGKTRQAAPGEVKYYPYKGEAIGPSVFPNVKGPLPLEYGGDFCLEAMTADCGWVSSTIDMAMFVSSIFGEAGRSRQPISPELAEIMVSRPALRCWDGESSYFAMGWEIENSGSKENFVAKKEGCLPGSEALVVHHADGTTIALAYNKRPWGYKDFQSESFKLQQKTWKARKYLSKSPVEHKP